MDNLTPIEQKIIDNLKVMISLNTGLSLEQLKSYFKDDPDYVQKNMWDKPSKTMQKLKRKGLVICLNKIWIYNK